MPAPNAHAKQKMNIGSGMGKRTATAFARRAKDFYPTPLNGVLPLLNHLKINSRFYEPCAGQGDLIDHLEKFGHVCTGASDIADHTDRDDIVAGLAVNQLLAVDADIFITNPPWSRPALHGIITHLMSLERQAWLLIDADWAHTKQAVPYLTYCRKIVAVGRLKWIPGTPHTGKDNCCWYLFSPWGNEAIKFYGRSG